MLKPIIAVDAMGGDFGPSVVVPGALKAAIQHNVKVLLVGQIARIEDEIAKFPQNLLKDADYEIVNASQVVEMSEKPSDILRRKKDASIQVACRLVRDGLAHGVVSAGHSGATVACGMFIIGRLPGVERPALASIMPTEGNAVILLDTGANMDCKPHHLFQFGLMAETFARDILQAPSPRVGLLSIGEEEGKGNHLVKETFELFKMTKGINFIGNVEGRDLFCGEVDVVVCDGFVGNVVLKLSEGLSGTITRMLKRELFSGILPKIGAFLAKPAFKRFAKVVDYAEAGGAPLLGLKGIALVCHGKSNAKAITSAIRVAGTFAEKKTNDRLAEAISANEELTRYGKAERS